MKIFRLVVLVALAINFVAVQAKPKLVDNGHKVKINYIGKLKDGRIFDSNTGLDPLEFVVGSGAMIRGFEQGVIGMKKKEKKTLFIPAAQAYGEAASGNIIEVTKANLPPDYVPEVGKLLGLNTRVGNINVRVIEIGDKNLIVDGNALLAGKDLIFEVEVVDIEEVKS